MTFAQPLLLLGMLAATIPLLVHLFDRRRPRQVPFAALSFVLRSQKRTASRLRLKRILLYALRTFIFLAVPFALARPSCVDDKVLKAHGAAATAIVVDTSFAMRWKQSGSSLFDGALKQAKAAVAELGNDEPVAIVPCARSGAPLTPLSFDKRHALSAIDEIKPSYEVADLNRCLEVAAHALDDSPLANRRVVLVSAMTETSLRVDVPVSFSKGPKGEQLKPEFVLRNVADEKPLDNHAIVDMKAEPAPQAGPRAWQYTFTVRNFSDEAIHDVPLELRVDGVGVGKGFVDVPARGTSQKTLTYKFQKPGPALVEGALTPDALEEDDTRGLVTVVPKDMRVLVVNGAPSPQKYKDEAYFVDSALSAPGSPVRAVVRDAEAAWREDFATFDALLLLNVEAPGADVAAKLAQFVSAGGGVFVSLGDRVVPEAYNASLSALLPRKLRVLKTAVEPGAADGSGRMATFGTLALTHPVLVPFVGKAREGLTSTRFSRYALFESEGSGAPVEVLATLDDGAPVMLASRNGKGRVFVFASSVDRDWCDVPIRTAFLPLMQRLTSWLTGSLDERDAVRARVGEVATLESVTGAVPAVAKSPSGVELMVATDAAGVATVGPLKEPGAHRVTNAAGQSLNALTFVATLDAAASDTTRVPTDTLKAWLGGDEVVRTAGLGGEGRQTPLWTWLLVAAAVAFFLEGLLLRRV